jgi:hypothetical protein
MKHGISILAVAALMLAMAAPALAVDMLIDNGDTETVTTGQDLSYGELDIIDGTLIVESGGKISFSEESFIAADTSGTAETATINAYGELFVEQFKSAQHTGDVATVVIGDGTNAASLSMVEGFLGKDGNATVTINNAGTMTASGDWSDALRIGYGTSTGSYVDILTGGTLELNALITDFDETLIKGNGVFGNWDKTYDAGAFDGDGGNIYTAIPEPATMSLLAIGGLALLRRKRRA